MKWLFLLMILPGTNTEHLEPLDMFKASIDHYVHDVGKEVFLSGDLVRLHTQARKERLQTTAQVVFEDQYHQKLLYNLQLSSFPNSRQLQEAHWNATLQVKNNLPRVGDTSSLLADALNTIMASCGDGSDAPYGISEDIAVFTVHHVYQQKTGHYSARSDNYLVDLDVIWKKNTMQISMHTAFLTRKLDQLKKHCSL